MEENYLLYVSISLIFLLFIFKLLHQSKRVHRNLPPMPPSLPIIGHLRLLNFPIHRNCLNLSSKYGPVISLRFGSRLAVIVSSSSAVKECFTKNDIVLANRPFLLSGKHLNYNNTTMFRSPYGDHWRNLRRIGAIEIFSSSRLNKFSGIRKDEVERLVRKLSRNSVNNNGFSKVHIQSSLSEMTLNMVMRMAAGKRYFGEDVTGEEEARKFRKLIKDLTVIGGISNPGDFIPILNWIPNSYEKRLINLSKRMDEFLQGLVDEHRRNKEQGRNTMIDHLLSLNESEPSNYDDQIIKGFILVLVIAGTDTSALALEWALSHLLNNPEVLKKAREEIDTQIGQERLVEETDIPKLQYLQAIITETLRLSPPAPMLSAHYTSEDCKISGYDIPRDTIVIVNAWAIQRDPNVWEDPTCFRPERHENKEIEVHKLLPFGMGRRACPGIGMAQRVMWLTLAALIQCFDWKRDGDEAVDMREGKGILMPKAVPLEAMCRARPIINKLFH